MYSPVGAGKLFETSMEHSQNVDNGMVMRSGVAKGVRIVSNNGNPMPALVLDGEVLIYFLFKIFLS